MKLLMLLLGFVILQSGLKKEEIDDVVHAVGVAVRDQYLDPEVGEHLSNALNSMRAKGEFAVTTQSDLADELTKALQDETHDKHLRVRPPGAARPMMRMVTDKAPSMVGRVDMLPNKIGFLEITNFGSKDGAEFDAAMAKLKDAQALIIDLGKNPGGTPEAVQYLSTYFFAKKTHLLDSMARGMKSS